MLFGCFWAFDLQFNTKPKKYVGMTQVKALQVGPSASLEVKEGYTSRSAGKGDFVPLNENNKRRRAESTHFQKRIHSLYQPSPPLISHLAHKRVRFSIINISCV